MRVLFHVDENNKWMLTQTNVKNILQENRDLDVVVLANAEAVVYYYDNPEYIPGVTYIACNNALKGRGLDPNIIQNRVKIVPSGVYEIVLLQEKNYRYIKP